MTRGTTAPSGVGGRRPIIVVRTKKPRRGGRRRVTMTARFIVDKVKGEFVRFGIGFHGDYDFILGVVRKVIGHVVARRWGRITAAVEYSRKVDRMTIR